MTRLGLALCVLAGAALAGCAARPASAPGSRAAALTTAPAAPAGSKEALARRLRARARDAESDRRWADAVAQWEVLVLLQPEEPAHRESLDSARRAALDVGTAHWKVAEAARSRRNPEAAVLAYLKVLAADPRHAGAAAALTTIEAERTAKVWLNRPPRGGYTPTGIGDEPAEKR